jgi:diacylglycerol kinase family enzyme
MVVTTITNVQGTANQSLTEIKMICQGESNLLILLLSHQFANDTIDTNIVSELDSPRIFLSAAEIGVGAEIIDRSKKIRDTVKSRILSAITSMITTIPTYSSNVCELSVDEGRKKLITTMTMAVIANGRFLGGGFMTATKVHTSDDLFDIVILKNSGSLKMLDEFENERGGQY